MVKFGNFTDEFKQGIQDYVDGKKIKDNPHKHATGRPWEDWKDGWGFARAYAYCRLAFKDGEAGPMPSDPALSGMSLVQGGQDTKADL